MIDIPEGESGRCWGEEFVVTPQPFVTPRAPFWNPRLPGAGRKATKDGRLDHSPQPHDSARAFFMALSQYRTPRSLPGFCF